MVDLSWLATEAQRIHGIFLDSFYALVTIFVVISAVLEYFKLPVGGNLQFTNLIGRVLMAFILLYSYKDFQNTLGDVIDALTGQIADINQVNTILKALAKKLHEFSWHNMWPLAKDGILAIISFVSIVCMYYSVFICNGMLLFTWTLLYALSPLLIAFYIFPQTAQVTKGLFSSLIQVSLWKVMWAILIALLWSTAFSQINKPEYQISFPTVIAFNLILAGTIFKTPRIVSLLSGPGIAAFMSDLGSIQVGPYQVSPSTPIKAAASAAVGYATGGASFAIKSGVRAAQMRVAKSQMTKTPGETPEATNKRLQKLYPAPKFKRARFPHSPIR